jgi:hypothetical protein
MGKKEETPFGRMMKMPKTPRYHRKSEPERSRREPAPSESSSPEVRKRSQSYGIFAATCEALIGVIADQETSE